MSYASSPFLPPHAPGLLVEDAADAYEEATANGGVGVLPPTRLEDVEGGAGGGAVISEVKLYGDVVLRFVSGDYRVRPVLCDSVYATSVEVGLCVHAAVRAREGFEHRRGAGGRGSRSEAAGTFAAAPPRCRLNRARARAPPAGPLPPRLHADARRAAAVLRAAAAGPRCGQ